MYRTFLALTMMLCVDLPVQLAMGGITTIALSGDPAPGTASGVTFSEINSAKLNNAGRVVLSADLIGPGIDSTNDKGIWSDRSGSLELVVSKGTAAPGTSVDFSLFSVPYLSDTGKMTFSAQVSGPGVDFSNDDGIWTDAFGSLQLVARDRDPAPGTESGVLFEDSSGGLQTTGEKTVFGAPLTDPLGNPSLDTGIWSNRSGSVELIALNGDPAPDTAAGIVFAVISQRTFINTTDQIAFIGRLAGPGVDDTNDHGIWSDRSGSMELIVRSGEPAPGTSVGVNFTQSFSPSSISGFNSLGQLAFGGGLAGPGVGPTNDQGIWSEGSGVLQLVAREGDQAPGTSVDFRFDVANFEAMLNALGHTMFHAALTGPGINDANDRGIWSDVSGSLELIAREGEQAPGTAPGIVFGKGPPSINSSPFGVPFMNDKGQIVVRSTLIGPGVDTNNDYGIWLYNDGQLELIVRKGDSLEVSPGENKNNQCTVVI